MDMNGSENVTHYDTLNLFCCYLSRQEAEQRVSARAGHGVVLCSRVRHARVILDRALHSNSMGDTEDAEVAVA